MQSDLGISVVHQFIPHSPLLTAPSADHHDPSSTNHLSVYTVLVCLPSTAFLQALPSPGVLFIPVFINTFCTVQTTARVSLFIDPFLDISDAAQALEDELLWHHVLHFIAFITASTSRIFS